MSTFIKIVAFSALAFLLLDRGFGVFGYGRLPYISLRSIGTTNIDPCAGKRRCLVAMLAPWCPACHASIPFMRSVRALAARSRDLGVQVVIGSGDFGQLDEMGRDVGGPVYLDVDGELEAGMRGMGMPRWSVIDADRKVVNYGAGLPNIDESGNRELFERSLKEYLKFF